ncbi:hypothetical protein AB0J86_21970 [Micromonospora sp. NPDC049559]|uniref:hypothetical protein n=1 Tax=Micromonospora sp. NPDC049559 TaxID=3155923 RepID=UPI003421640E
MRIFVNERPQVLPAACAPVSAARVILAVDTPWLSRVHQAQAQAELILAEARLGSYGTNGSTGGSAPFAAKRMVVRGVPPRGKPV